MKILMIVARLPPSIDGVGDYSLRIAEVLRQNQGIDTKFLTTHPDCQGDRILDGFTVEKLNARQESCLTDYLVNSCLNDSINVVLLHFSGYGYAKWACPFWLIQGIKNWKIRCPEFKLITMFHELYNTVKSPWSHSLWVGPVQKKLVAQLSCLSDFCLTNNELYSNRLTQLSRGKHANTPTIPVPSTVGEISTILPLFQRNRRLVVFGQGGTRLRMYQQSLNHLNQTCRQLEISEIIDIGPPIEIPKLKIDIKVESLGVLPSDNISDVLSNSFCGVINYHPANPSLSKSSIWSAYCSHGILPISYGQRIHKTDGLFPGRNYLTPRLIDDTNSAQMQDIANLAYLWYREHSVDTQSSVFAKIIRRCLYTSEHVNSIKLCT